jgi:hypothetical protein
MEVIHHHLRSSTKVGVIIYCRRTFVPSGTGLFVMSAEVPWRQCAWIQDTAGVSPLLFLSVWPFYRPAMHVWLLQLWFATTVLYFVAGCIILLANYYRTESLQERRRIGALFATSILFGLIILHNFFVRNWTAWFGGVPPALFSPMSFVAEAILFLPVPLTLTYYVLSQCVNERPQKRRKA